MAKQTTVKDLREGTYFIRTGINDSTIYCRGKYNRSTGRYECINYHNRSQDMYLKGADKATKTEPNEQYNVIYNKKV